MRIKTNALSVQNTVKNLKGGFKVVKTNRPFVLLDGNGVAIGNYVNEASAARAVRRLTSIRKVRRLNQHHVAIPSRHIVDLVSRFS